MTPEIIHCIAVCLRNVEPPEDFIVPCIVFLYKAKKVEVSCALVIDDVVIGKVYVRIIIDRVMISTESQVG